RNDGVRGTAAYLHTRRSDTLRPETRCRRPSPTRSRRPSPTPSRRPSPTPSRRPSPTPSRRPSPTPSRRPSPTPSRRPSPTPSRRPSPPPSRRPSPTPSRRPSPTPVSQTVCDTLSSMVPTRRLSATIPARALHDRQDRPGLRDARRRLPLQREFLVRQRDRAHGTVRRLPLGASRTEREVQRVEHEPVTYLTERVNSITRPPVLVRCGDHVGAQRVQFHVPETRKPIPLVVQLDHPRPLVPQRPGASILAVEVARVAGVCLLHGFGEGRLRRRCGDDVVVVAHQRVRVDVQAMFRRFR